MYFGPVPMTRQRSSVLGDSPLALGELQLVKVGGGHGELLVVNGIPSRRGAWHC